MYYLLTQQQKVNFKIYVFLIHLKFCGRLCTPSTFRNVKKWEEMNPRSSPQAVCIPVYWFISTYFWYFVRFVVQIYEHGVTMERFWVSIVFARSFSRNLLWVGDFETGD